MVNNAFRAFLLKERGTEDWEAIVASVGLDADIFTALAPYDDGVTLAMVVAIAERMEMPVPDLLRAVGASWVDYAKSTSFASVYAMAGSSVAEVIGNLNGMHTRIRSSLPDLDSPDFECRTLPGGLLEITYRSSREGLFPFVEGVLMGMAADFGEPLKIVGFEQIDGSSGRWTIDQSEETGVSAA